MAIISKVFIISRMQKIMNKIFPVFVFLTMLSMISVFPTVFADSVSVSIPEGTSVRGCESTDECYIPFGVKIDVGDEVVWTNDDMAFHTVTSGNPADGPDDLFDSGMFSIGEQFSHKFEDSGNFDYFCTLHPWMQGTVVVQVSSGDASENGGGCLIATATYGSELAPQVQQLRELRDNQLLQTESGSAFMESFNDLYYSFSPQIADYERENPIFKEVVKISITPMISSLSILNQVEMDSEAKVLGYGISLILLNIGMYVGVPLVAVIGIKKKF
jgi:plastocyanin